MRYESLTPEFVEFMPEELKPGILYVSERFETAIHLCACGECGKKTVTPWGSWNPHAWTLTNNAGTITLSPSIGNWQFPCKAHYHITENRVVWC
jgi:hypothetical protein